jgi:hypothetical protein
MRVNIVDVLLLDLPDEFILVVVAAFGGGHFTVDGVVVVEGEELFVVNQPVIVQIMNNDSSWRFMAVEGASL